MVPYMVEIEYLGFTGTQAINTLLLPNTLDFDILYTCYNHIKYGWVTQNNGNGTWIASTVGAVRYKNFNTRYYISDSRPNMFESWRYDMTSGFYRNGTLLKSFSASIGGTQISNVPLYIGQTYDMTAHNIESDTFSYDNRIKSVKIYRNGTLVRDYIPVRVGTTGYLYDKVSGQLFGNAGTGSFVLGPDVAPAAYANEIAFLESTGSQYIDTGVVGSSDLSVVLKCYYPASSSSLSNTGFLFGSRVDNNDRQYGLIHSYASNFRYGNGASNSWANPEGRVLIFDNTESHEALKVYDTDNNLITTLTAPIATFNNNLNIVLFGLNNNGTVGCTSNRIYSLKMYEDTTLVRDFIPVEYNNIGYLYDNVSGEFFANQGTGKFVLGHRAPRFDGKACARSYTRRQLMMADVVAVKPYISNGLVFHLDGADATTTSWVDRVNNVTFNMHNVTCDGKRVYFNGTSSYGKSSTVVNYHYNSSTIEVVIYKSQRVGFVFEPLDTNAIRYIQGGSYVNFTWGAAGKRSGVADQGVGKIITHSINMDRDICNSKLIPFASNDAWNPKGNGTFLGRRGDGSNSFQGNVYQIRIYNRKLSEAEILFNQEQDRKRYGIQF